jgi:hypothetical protein
MIGETDMKNLTDLRLSLQESLGCQLTTLDALAEAGLFRSENIEVLRKQSGL